MRHINCDATDIKTTGFWISATKKEPLLISYKEFISRFLLNLMTLVKRRLFFSISNFFEFDQIVIGQFRAILIEADGMPCSRF